MCHCTVRQGLRVDGEGGREKYLRVHDSYQMIARRCYVMMECVCVCVSKGTDGVSWCQQQTNTRTHVSHPSPSRTTYLFIGNVQLNMAEWQFYHVKQSMKCMQPACCVWPIVPLSKYRLTVWETSEPFCFCEPIDSHLQPHVHILLFFQ